MQLILEIEDTQQEVFFNIIRSLKDGIVKNYSVLKNKTTDSIIPAVTDEEEAEILNILNNMTDDDRSISDTRTYTIHIA